MIMMMMIAFDSFQFICFIYTHITETNEWILIFTEKIYIWIVNLYNTIVFFGTYVPCVCVNVQCKSVFALCVYDHDDNRRQKFFYMTTRIQTANISKIFSELSNSKDPHYPHTHANKMMKIKSFY